jgi:hypothetical protein
MPKLRSVTRRDFLQTTAAGALACGLGSSLLAAPTATDGPAIVARRGNKRLLVVLDKRSQQCVRLAAESLRRVGREQLGLEVEIRIGGDNDQEFGVIAMCAPWESQSAAVLEKANIKLGADKRLSAFGKTPESLSSQGFVAARLPGESGDRLILAANEPVGLRNAMLTLTDRLHFDAHKSVVADPFWGSHVPAFQTRHLKTDAMNLGRFRLPLEYWDPTLAEGVNAFADWLAGFRITDYELLAFMRGWGATYKSERFPNLADPQHPNVKLEFYPQLIDRLHGWGMRVWGSDIYMASGYTMELGTEPRMASPLVDIKKVRPFKAGQGLFGYILGDPLAIVCLSNPIAADYYANLTTDLLAHYPKLDGLNFHMGHAFMSRVCRCPKCKNMPGNREALYRCFARVYEAAVAQRPDLRLTLSAKMFGDATRSIVEHAADFPRLELFCWLRWIADWTMEVNDARVAFGHEDGGGGFVGDFDRIKSIAEFRKGDRDQEWVIQSYMRESRQAHLSGISWESQLQREIENQFFTFSQLSWEPDLSWKELARRYVIRYERTIDQRLVEAYQSALEANAAISYWGGGSTAQGVAQNSKLLELPYVRQRVAALGDALRKEGLIDRDGKPADAKLPPPVAFDLRRSLVKTYGRVKPR